MSVGVTDNLTTKTCTCCGKVRAIADYHRKTPDRHDSRCKPCVSLSKAKFYRAKKKMIKKPQSKTWVSDKVTIELYETMDSDLGEDLQNLLEKWVLETLESA